MHCSGCTEKVQKALGSIPGVQDVSVTLTPPLASITMKDHISTATFNNAVSVLGAYGVSDMDAKMSSSMSAQLPEIKATTYLPIILIALYLGGGVLLRAYTSDNWSPSDMMSNFMGGFFIIFSFFKMLDIKGFAQSYSTYDIIAAKIKGYGFIYPFIELALGVSFLVRFNPFVTNLATLIIMGVSIIGVLQSVLNKKKIQCACLGTVFNLPMSTVTIIEDGLMIIMSAIMLFIKM